ncbi:acetolactate decarboxylase [Staphylococcus agnetis]|uniref:acetolactate decarboxylase n=1 Tax=Staphylococcus agnetis TaxID=985762 RepID=UPI0004E2EF0E|nr:acetolactate decarboxylase [Staphylococcus agnetis]KFE42151.1 alpha-acetolactate decarboxylase [Staphylococcus agnetis]NJH65766.1 acetolactate decarboxylase [Staphylococcus agnetis]NJH96554.1 acetolactate decarboxylase [Staphylococcus agnetis]PTH47623.1 acetolactate decarboxylase [Staphylococcus agnetis]PTH74470.1 acetolactate decarboxylase [Staphylococcus agnetis]
MLSHTIYQHGTLGVIMTGALEGTTSIGEILRYGNYGIGTLEGGDGEVMIQDGIAYHISATDEKVRILADDARLPYANVVQFYADTSFECQYDNEKTLYEKIRQMMRSKNLFSVVKISGRFKHMHGRVMPKQNPPYRKLVESARQQPEYQCNQVEGTIIAFYTPDYYHGVGSGGFHAHFLSKDQTFLVHVLDFETINVRVEIQNCTQFHQILPTTSSFLEKDIDFENILEDIKEAE